MPSQLTERGWCERLVDVAPDDDAAHLRFVLSPGPTPASRLLVERRLAALPPEDAAGACVELTALYSHDAASQPLRAPGLTRKMAR